MPNKFFSAVKGDPVEKRLPSPSPGTQPRAKADMTEKTPNWPTLPGKASSAFQGVFPATKVKQHAVDEGLA